jgi:hypothetical protein
MHPNEEEAAVAFIGPVDDRLKIRERLDSYSDAVFRGDVDDYLACWQRPRRGPARAATGPPCGPTAGRSSCSKAA